MNKSILITGGTDGIGAATASEFAKQNYSVHILGSSNAKGEHMLEQLQQCNPNGKHLFYAVDLSTKDGVNNFITSYLKEHKTLDVLVLNAGVHPQKISLSKDNIDLTFSIGYISRYLLALRLNKLLAASPIGKVLHVNGSVIGKIHFKQLSQPKYNKMISVWQNSVGSALLCCHWHSFSNTKVDHIHWNPGIVNTNTVKSQSKIVQLLSKALGMIEAEQAGEAITKVIISNENKSIGASFFVKGKKKKKPKIHADKSLFDELINFSEEFTRVKINTYDDDL
jgi:NAD(P)-dependent dehydrogenase (short-subunit alcohol dehydrogenase family)